MSYYRILLADDEEEVRKAMIRENVKGGEQA